MVDSSPQLLPSVIITLDGPAGSGKSAVARLLASQLGLEFLDTGAMYRGLTVRVLDRGIDPKTQDDKVVELARHQPMRFDWTVDPPRLYVGEQDMTARLRDRDVTAAVSDVAAIGGVRQILVETQRHIGEQHRRLVSEGRDQGSVVFPQAQVKFYIEASVQVRAQRRADQIRSAGQPADLEQIRQKMIDRDHHDSTRRHAPLICPADAQRIDTSEMKLHDVVDLLAERVAQKLGRSL